MNIIQTHHLNYAFGKRPVLADLNLAVPQGSIFGFLGPNGAGKTTTIRLLLGLLRAPKGTVQLFGEDLQTSRLETLRKTGSLIETPSLYKHLSGWDNLEVARRLLGAPKNRVPEVLAIVKLTADAGRKVKEYSLGMGQRLGIALALLSDPELLILDEPTNGLDPQGIKEVRELMISLNRDFGKTIFVSSHLLSEIQKTVTHLAIIHQGRLLFQNSIAALHALNNKTVSIETDNNLHYSQVLRAANYQVGAYVNGAMQVQIQDKADIAGINQLLVQNGAQVFYLSASQHNLEEIFFNLTDNS